MVNFKTKKNGRVYNTSTSAVVATYKHEDQKQRFITIKIIYRKPNGEFWKYNQHGPLNNLTQTVFSMTEQEVIAFFKKYKVRPNYCNPKYYCFICSEIFNKYFREDADKTVKFTKQPARYNSHVSRGMLYDASRHG